MQVDNLLITNLINAGISLIMGFFMFFFQKNPFKLGTGYWASGSSLIGFALLFKAFLPPQSIFLSLIPPLLITIGLYFYLAGIWRFKNKAIKHWIIIGLPVLDILQSILFLVIFEMQRLQLLLHILILIIYCSLALLEMLQLNDKQKYLKKIFRLNAFSFTLFLCLLLINSFEIISQAQFNTYEVNIQILVIHIISGLVMIALTFGFLLAVNIRLNTDLEGQVESNTKFLSIIAHDLRGPIGNISNFLELLQNENIENRQQRAEYIKILNGLSHSTYHLLQNLLEWAISSKNLNNFKSEKIDLSQLIEQNLDLFKSSSKLKSIELNINLDEKAYISGNANMLQTIVRNLVSNAIKFTPESGTINVRTQQTKNTIYLTVTDTGRGIPQEKIQSLFTFQTNVSTFGTNGEIGSGLGLALCKELTSRMNGKINIESLPNKGTTVKLEFPALA